MTRGIPLTAVLVAPSFGDLQGRNTMFGNENGGQFCDILSLHLML